MTPKRRSVASRALHSSLWPTVLASDSTLTQGVRSSVRGLTLGATVAAALISLASIVTPLGLYEDTASVTARTTTFRYARDNSSFGLGTGPQGVYPYSRLCSIGHGFAQGPAPCPYTGDQVVLSDNGEGLEWSFPNGTMTSKVPDIVRQIYSSGTIGTRTTVSNFFDIQWRQVGLFSQRFMDNGTAYPVDQFRMVDSLVLDGSYKIVEGLVVDALRGGVGFRNHTVPSGLTGTGAEWTEDLLFIEPESACVDTNLTIEFTINLTNRSLSRGIQDLVLVDRGGFANLDVDKYPEYDHPNAQANPDLWRRAYKAAVLNNAYTMFYLNVSNPANQTTNTSAFRYRNSRVGQEFRLNADSLETYKALDLTPQFGYYLFSSGTTGPRVNHSNVSMPSAIRPLHVNPVVVLTPSTLQPFGINKTELANVGKCKLSLCPSECRKH